MQFLPRAECEAFFARLGFDSDGLVAGSRGADRFKIVEVFYDPRRHAEPIGKSIAASQGSFAQCLVWCRDLVFGGTPTWRRSRTSPCSASATTTI
jgi:hypothetical protein